MLVSSCAAISTTLLGMGMRNADSQPASLASFWRMTGGRANQESVLHIAVVGASYMQAVGCHFASGQTRSRLGSATDEPPISDGDIFFFC